MVNAESIKLNGFGYRIELMNFDKMLKKFNISDEVAYNYLSGKIQTVEYESMRGYMIKLFTKNAKVKTKMIEYFIDNLSQMPMEFDILLQGV